MSNALGTTDRSHMPPNSRAWIAGARSRTCPSLWPSQGTERFQFSDRDFYRYSIGRNSASHTYREISDLNEFNLKREVKVRAMRPNSIGFEKC